MTAAAAGGAVQAPADRLDAVLALGDDALVAAQRLGQWCSRAPEMEEDIALANIALDQLGAARLLLTYAGELEGAGRDEDDLAYLRDDRDFRNCLLVEQPNGDFAVTMAKLLFLAAYQRLRYDALAAGTDRLLGADGRLAAIAGKARKEVAYHWEHAVLWTLRLGDGTDESHLRMQAAVDEVWPYTHELRAEVDDAAWLAAVEPVLAEATLARPADGWAPTGARQGLHTEHLSYLLAEMQVVHRARPGASW